MISASGRARTCCIAVVDAQRARVFTLALADLPELERGPELSEQEDLLNPEAGTKGRDLFSEVGSGRNRAPHGAAFNYDDHRSEHYAELRRRFARRVVDSVVAWVKRVSAARLVVVAEPRMLGCMREELARQQLPNGLDVKELREDLTALPVARLRKALMRHGLFPEARAKA